ncbi:MAG: MarC family protein [Alphaproteobacteria bacterium]
MHDVFFQNLLKAIVAIDPISLIPIFTAITTTINLRETIKLSVIVFIITSFLLTFFCIYGNNFLVYMGVSLGSFQIVGGLFLLIISYEMVLEKRVKRKKNLTTNLSDDFSIDSIAVFPISIPLIAGPSAITLSVLISKNFDYTLQSFYLNVSPLILTLLATSIIIFLSKVIGNFFNMTILNIIQRIFGLILGALAIQFVINGIKLEL